MPDHRPKPTEADLNAIEALARENESETYRGPLLALGDEVRRLRKEMNRTSSREARM